MKTSPSFYRLSRTIWDNKNNYKNRLNTIFKDVLLFLFICKKNNIFWVTCEVSICVSLGTLCFYFQDGGRVESFWSWTERSKRISNCIIWTIYPCLGLWDGWTKLMLQETQKSLPIFGRTKKESWRITL